MPHQLPPVLISQVGQRVCRDLPGVEMERLGWMVGGGEGF